MDEITFSKKKNPENNKKAAKNPIESKKRGGQSPQYKKINGFVTTDKEIFDDPSQRQFTDGQGYYIYVSNKDLPPKR